MSILKSVILIFFALIIFFIILFKVITFDVLNQYKEKKNKNSYISDEIENKILTKNELVSDLSGNTFPLPEISGYKTLFFRFSEAGCSPCIQNQVGYLKRIKDSGIYRIVVLVNCQNLRMLQILINSHELDFEIYRLNSTENWGPPGFSYYFTMDENTLVRKNVFVISGKKPETSVEYFKKIIPETKKLFEAY